MMQLAKKPIKNTASLLLLIVVLAMSRGEVFAGSLVAQAPAPVTNVVSGRSFTVEIGIVVVMFGGALFAVCRSSNRT